MSLHRLLAMRVGAPRPDELAGFYAEVGLATDGDGRVTSPDGGTQVVIEEAPYRQLLGVEIGAAHERDLDDIGGRLADLGVTIEGRSSSLTAVDPISHVRFRVTVAEPLAQAGSTAVVDNRPGATVRRNERASAVSQGPRPPRQQSARLRSGSSEPGAAAAILPR